MKTSLIASLLLLATALPAAAQDATHATDRATIDGCLQAQKDAPAQCIGVVYKACGDEPEGSTTAAMGVCALRETIVWQAKIAASLAQLRDGPLGATTAEPSNRPPENKRARAVPGSAIIGDMQRTWQLWRAKMCDTESLEFEGGSLSRVVYGTCVYQETGRHALWLKSLLDDSH